MPGPGWLGRRRWDLERFGITPRKLHLRVMPPEAPPVVCVSIPKAGTHLVERTVCLHPLYYRALARKVMPNEEDVLLSKANTLRRGQLLSGHPIYSYQAASVLDASGVRSLFCVRDPRDILVSRAHYIYSYRRHAFHEVALRYPALRDRLELLLAGDAAHGISPFAETIERYLGWLDSHCHVIRFEDVVDEATRFRTISAVFSYLGVPLEPESVRQIADEVVSPVSRTFRRGKVGEWPEAFDDELLARFNEAASSQLLRLGYRLAPTVESVRALG